MKNLQELKFDYVIIGSGIAGLSVARVLSQHGKIAIITKNEIEEANTRYAQGGIAAAMGKTDLPKLHLKDTIRAGAELCDEKMVTILVENGPKRVQELIDLGCDFDRNRGEIDFAKEGAHSQKRVLHAGDRTGKVIENTIAQSLLSERKVEFFPFTSAINLLTDEGECKGCLAESGKKLLLFRAKVFVLATGGSCQIYERNTNPSIATGDGIALAYRAGANVQDMEFIQFHPTTLYASSQKPISLFLISEAVRGEGAYLRNVWGHRFMPNYHEMAELGPRDIVARAIIDQMTKTNAPHVYLDLSTIKTDLSKRFPSIYEKCLETGINIDKDFIPVAPAAHYFIGGVQTDEYGQTNIKKLYAVGEVASNGIHGANRLASNSLLEGLVFGFRAAQHICDSAYKFAKVQNIEKLIPKEKGKEVVKSDILIIKQAIRRLMWKYAGIIRDRDSLSYLSNKLESFKDILAVIKYEEGLIEAQNMLTVANLVFKFALKRTESRGAHFRTDFPNLDDENWQKHLFLNSKDKEFQITHPVASRHPSQEGSLLTTDH